jgi:hypothetical protein
MDCEGAEFSLLDPVTDPILLKTNILVEIHRDFGDQREIIRKFVGTHNIVEISPSIRTALEILVGSIENVDVLRAADERRSVHTTWLFLEVNSR